MTFGIISVMLLGVAGIAMDASRGYNVRSSLQTALDAAMLSAASRMYDANVDLADITSRYLDANWRDKLGVDSISVSVQLVESGKLTGRASTRIPITLGRVIGLDDMTVSVESEIVAGSQDIEAVLVVDNTGSMAGAKLDALKSSARTLVEAVFSGRNADQHAKIGIVPFGQYVNVGMANRNRSWMSVPPDTSIPREWCRNEAPIINTYNCRTITYTYTNDGITHTGQYQACDHDYGPPAWVCTPYNETYTWYGCAGSREAPLNIRDESYGTPIPGIMNVGCPSEITPLSNGESTLLSKIDGLVATGETYIPAGLVWGWRVLSKVEPYAEAYEYDETVNGKPIRKILVLMTDGANTKSLSLPYSDGSHNGSDAGEANATTAALCTNIKAKGIEVYTIAFDVTDTAIKDILRSCASQPGQFFDARDSSALDVAFRNIARDLIAMRVAR